MPASRMRTVLMLQLHRINSASLAAGVFVFREVVNTVKYVSHI